MILFIHDNHLTVECGRAFFGTSTFHLFLKGFDCPVVLSSPCLNIGEKDRLNVDAVSVFLRPGYGKAISFYLRLPFLLWKTYRKIYGHMKDSDVVIIAGPCCSAFIAYLAAVKQKKRIVAYFVGNNIEVVRKVYAGKPFVMRVAAQCIAWWEWKVMERIAIRHSAVALGDDIYDLIKPKAKRLMKGMTSLISIDDVSEPKVSNQDGPWEVITVGRLSKEKDLVTAIYAVAQLRQKGLDVRYRIIGDGPARQELEELIDKLQLNEVVIMQGQVIYEELKAYYMEADLFVLPSITEGVAKVLLEAMAAGIPIVGSKAGGTPSVLGNGDRGWLFDAGDAKTLTLFIEEALTDSKDRDMRMNNAYAYIRAHTREAMAKKLVDFVMCDASSEEKRNT